MYMYIYICMYGHPKAPKAAPRWAHAAGCWQDFLKIATKCKLQPTCRSTWAILDPP